MKRSATLFAPICIVLCALLASVNSKVTKTHMDRRVVEKMLTPLLSKYSIHGPLAYTEDGLRDVLDSIQTKIIEEFRRVEKYYVGRVKEECGNRTLSHLDKMNDIFGDLPKPQINGTGITKDTKCHKGEEGDDCRKYKAYLAEQLRRRQMKEKIYNEKKAQRKRRREVLVKAEAKLQSMKGVSAKNVLSEIKKAYVNADAILQQAEDGTEHVNDLMGSMTAWAKKGLLEASLSYSKVLGTMNTLADLLDHIEQ